jgi:hypothetical protein
VGLRVHPVHMDQREGRKRWSESTVDRASGSWTVWHEFTMSRAYVNWNPV